MTPVVGEGSILTVPSSLNKTSHRLPPGTEDVLDGMRNFGDIPRFLWIFPKIWHWKLPKCRCERLLYVILLLTLNGYLIYFSLTVNYCLYVFVFLGANFALNLSFYLLMKVSVFNQKINEYNL